jgi:hypothetical protein
MALGRNLDGAVAGALTVSYFPATHLGITGEISLLGGTYRATCRIINPDATIQNAQVCGSFQQSSQSSRNVALTAGLIYRVMAHRRLSPYASARLGLLLGSKSTVTLNGERVGSLVRFYHDPSDGRVVPVGMIGAGITASAGPGYQFRWEVRNVVMGLEAVNGTTSGSPNQEPEHHRRYYQRWTFLLGFEIVLDRVRGHRY